MDSSMPKLKTRRSGQGGFSLIEAIIVVAIFTVAILGTMTMHLMASKTNNSARKVTMATEYANDTMELLLQLPGSSDYFNIDDDDDGSTDENDERVLISDGIDNDGDTNIDEADELEWFRTPGFQPGAGYRRGITDPNIPEDPYYVQIFDLTWDITDINSDADLGNADMDAKRIDITVRIRNSNKFIELSNVRNNLF